MRVYMLRTPENSNEDKFGWDVRIQAAGHEEVWESQGHSDFGPDRR